MVRRVVAAVVLAVLLAGCGGVGSAYRGTVEEVLTSDDEADRVGLRVRLDGREIVSTDLIALYLNADELRCTDRSPLDVTDVEEGREVFFTRVGDSADMSNPPGVAGRDVRVDCG